MKLPKLQHILLTALLSMPLVVPLSHGNNHGSGVSLQQAAAIAQKTYAGKVIRSEAAQRGGRQIYIIRLLNKGRVKEVTIDSQSGRIINP